MTKTGPSRSHVRGLPPQSAVAAILLLFLGACSDGARCPPSEIPRTDPNWCDPIVQTGGWGPILGVVSFAAVLIGVTYLLVRGTESRRRRFAILGIVAYASVGLAVLTYVNAKINVSLSDMLTEPGPYVLQMLGWPLILMSYLGGSWGR